MDASPSNPLSGQVLVPADLLQYQERAVVSRVIAKTKAGNVTLFAFDAGQELSEHTAPFDALVQVLDGQVRITIAGRPMVVAAGQMVLMPANIPHALQAITRFKMLLTILRNA